MFKKIRNIILIAFGTLILTSCASPRKNIFMPTEMLDKPNKIIIGHLEAPANASFIRQGQAGLLDEVVIAAAMNKMKTRLAQTNSNDYIQNLYYDKYKDFFLKHNFEVKVMQAPLTRKKLFSPPKKGLEYAVYDYTPLKTLHNVDYALILDLQRFGVVRDYYGFIPTSKPFTNSIVNIALVNLADNTIIGEYNGNVIENIQGNWDAPPEFHALIQALQASLTHALQESYVIFSAQ
jgi:hypothetical protein